MCSSLHEVARQLGHLLEVGLQQRLRQVDQDGRGEEEHDLADDVGAAQRLRRLNGLEVLEHPEEVGDVVGQVVDAVLFLGHDGPVEARQLHQAVEGVVCKLCVMPDFQMELEEDSVVTLITSCYQLVTC